MKNITVDNVIEALKELQDWSPEGDTPAFESVLKTIEINLKCQQYDANDTLITFC